MIVRPDSGSGLSCPQEIENYGGRACKPDSVRCVGFPQRTQRGDHSSRSRIASGLKQPTRGLQRLTFSSATHSGWASPPLLFGLAPRGVFRASRYYHRDGGLLPHLFTLAKCARPKEASPRFFRRLAAEVQAHRRFIFCGTFRGRAAKLACARFESQPPGVTRRVALPWPTRLISRAHHGWSPDFPPVDSACAKSTGDHPTHPPKTLYPIMTNWCSLSFGQDWPPLFVFCELNESVSNAVSDRKAVTSGKRRVAQRARSGPPASPGSSVQEQGKTSVSTPGPNNKVQLYASHCHGKRILE